VCIAYEYELAISKKKSSRAQHVTKKIVSHLNKEARRARLYL